MSFLLAIESSTPHLSAVLFDGEKILGEMNVPPDDRGHAEKLLPLIHSLLSEKRISLPQLKGIALSVGPGSYTSLRVGAATAIGLATVHSLPLYPVSSLKVLAMSAGVGAYRNTPVLVAPVLKAGRGRVYAALFRKREEGKKIILETVVKENVFLPDELSAILAKQGDRIFRLEPPEFFPRAAEVGRLVLSGEVSPCGIKDLKMNYLQEPDLGKKEGG